MNYGWWMNQKRKHPLTDIDDIMREYANSTVIRIDKLSPKYNNYDSCQHYDYATHDANEDAYEEQ